MISPFARSSNSAVSRRHLLRASAAGVPALFGSRVLARRTSAAHTSAGGAASAASPAKSVIFLFLTGGASQHDTFDMKPEATDTIRGEFHPIATKTPGTHICEHMPQLAQRSHLWSLCRSLSHTHSGHDKGTYLMLTGRSVVPPTFRSSKPQSVDHPSIAAIAGASTTPRNNMPPSAILPEKIYHSNTGVYPGQFAGLLGTQHEPWLIEATDKPHAYHSYSGAFPEYLFDLHKGQLSDKLDWRFEVPNISPPQEVIARRFRQRMDLLRMVENRQADSGGSTTAPSQAVASYEAVRQSALSLIADPEVRQAIDVRSTDPKTLERYGDNSFGWSLLMARRLIDVGVNMVQVNMGNFGSWDLHGNNFPCLKNYLFPPTDQAVSALLDDLADSGRLDDTLVVMAGEFGRTPRISHIARNIYKYPGRDHWAPLQTALFAGGGVAGGRVIGSSDNIGAYPASDRQTPESFAATIYHALGIPRQAVWHDVAGRPYPVYMADPINGLFA